MSDQLELAAGTGVRSPGHLERLEIAEVLEAITGGRQWRPARTEADPPPDESRLTRNVGPRDL